MEQLQNAVEEMDIDLMDEIMEKLEGFQYSESLQGMMDKLIAYVTNMDSEKVADTIRKIRNQIG